MIELESDLRRLPQPALPEGLAEALKARVARIDEDGLATSRDAVESQHDRSAWAAGLAGLTLGLGAWAYRLSSGEVALDVISSRIGGIDGLVQWQPATPAVVVLAAGLGLYLAGFFAPLRKTGQRS